MEILNNLSKMLWPKKNNTVLSVFALLAFIGFADATYLTLEHFQGRIPPCTVVNGCESVLTSPYASVGPIPVALFGALYYLVVLCTSILSWQTKSKKLFLAIARFTLVGLLASIYFFSLQALVLHAWCLYCLGSVATSTLLFVTGVYTLRKHHTF